MMFLSAEMSEVIEVNFPGLDINHELSVSMHRFVSNTSVFSLTSQAGFGATRTCEYNIFISNVKLFDSTSSEFEFPTNKNKILYYC